MLFCVNKVGGTWVLGDAAAHPHPPHFYQNDLWELPFSSHQTYLSWGGSLSTSSRTTVTGALKRAQPSFPHLRAVSFCWAGGPLLKGGSVPSRNLWFQDLNISVGTCFGRVACVVTLERKFLCPFSWGRGAGCEGGGACALAVEFHQCFLKPRLSRIHRPAHVWLRRPQTEPAGQPEVCTENLIPSCDD